MAFHILQKLMDSTDNSGNGMQIVPIGRVVIAIVFSTGNVHYAHRRIA